MLHVYLDIIDMLSAHVIEESEHFQFQYYTHPYGRTLFCSKTIRNLLFFDSYLLLKCESDDTSGRWTLSISLLCFCVDLLEILFLHFICCITGPCANHVIGFIDARSKFFKSKYST